MARVWKSQYLSSSHFYDEEAEAQLELVGASC